MKVRLETLFKYLGVLLVVLAGVYLVAFAAFMPKSDNNAFVALVFAVAIIVMALVKRFVDKEVLMKRINAEKFVMKYLDRIQVEKSYLYALNMGVEMALADVTKIFEALHTLMPDMVLRVVNAKFYYNEPSFKKDENPKENKILAEVDCMCVGDFLRKIHILIATSLENSTFPILTEISIEVYFANPKQVAPKKELVEAPCDKASLADTGVVETGELVGPPEQGEGSPDEPEGLGEPVIPGDVPVDPTLVARLLPSDATAGVIDEQDVPADIGDDTSLKEKDPDKKS